jgi:hypothetical protein
MAGPASRGLVRLALAAVVAFAFASPAFAYDRWHGPRHGGRDRGCDRGRDGGARCSSAYARSAWAPYLGSASERYSAARWSRFRAHYGRDARWAWRRYGNASVCDVGCDSWSGSCRWGDSCRWDGRGSSRFSWDPGWFRTWRSSSVRGPAYALAVLDRRAASEEDGIVVAADEGGEDAAPAPRAALGPNATPRERLFAGDYDGAAAGFEAAVAANPDDASSWLGLAHASFARRRYGAAADALRSAARLGALSSATRVDVAATYEDPAAFQALWSALDSRVRFRLDDVDARLVLAWLETSLDRRDDARDDLHGVLVRSPDDAAALALSKAPAPAAAPGK